MSPKTISVSVLESSQPLDPGLQNTLQNIPELRLLKGARDPDTFLSSYEDRPPDLVLVALNGKSAIPAWLNGLVERLTRSKVLVCSQSRDPDFLIQVMRSRAGGFLPLPLDQEELRPILEEIKVERVQQAEVSQSQIVAVTGTKGGVGTTSVAVNLAVALAEILSGDVVLVDLARPFPHVGQFLDFKTLHSIRELAESSEKLDSLYIQKVIQKHNSGLDVVLGSQPFSFGPPTLKFDGVVEPRSIGRVFEALRSSYSWILVDLGAWVDPFYFQILQKTDQVLLVTELTVPDLRDLSIIRALWREWDLDESTMKVVVNRFIKDYSLGLKDIETACFRSAFFTLPYDHEALREAINQGIALGDLAPRSKLWRKLKDLAAVLLAELERQTGKQVADRPGLLRRLLK